MYDSIQETLDLLRFQKDMSQPINNHMPPYTFLDLSDTEHFFARSVDKEELEKAMEQMKSAADEDTRNEAMARVKEFLSEKYLRPTPYAVWLWETQSHPIEYITDDRDLFWGVDPKNGQGENWMGEILMDLREELLTPLSQVPREVYGWVYRLKTLCKIAFKYGTEEERANIVDFPERVSSVYARDNETLQQLHHTLLLDFLKKIRERILMPGFLIRNLEGTFLDNAYPTDIKVRGQLYPNAWEAYEDLINQYGSIADKQVRLALMKEVLESKFSDANLAGLLLDTEDAFLVYSGPDYQYGNGRDMIDHFWGVGEKIGHGSNYLGMLLMELRSEIRSRQEQRDYEEIWSSVNEQIKMFSQIQPTPRNTIEYFQGGARMVELFDLAYDGYYWLDAPDPDEEILAEYPKMKRQMLEAEKEARHIRTKLYPEFKLS